MQADPGGVAAALQIGTNSDGSGSYLVASVATVYSPSGAALLTLPVSSGTVTVDRHSPNRRTADLAIEAVAGGDGIGVPVAVGGSTSITQFVAAAAYGDLPYGGGGTTLTTTTAAAATITPVAGITTVPLSAIIPTGPLSTTAPFGNEIVLQSGVLTAQGWQFVPLGRFVILTATMNDTISDLTCSLHCVDRSWLVGSRTLKAAYNLPASGGNFAAELQALISTTWPTTAGYPSLLYSIMPTTATVPNSALNEGQDPWQAAQDMAASLGYELFFDVFGNVVAYPTPTPNALSPQWAFVETLPSPNGTVSTPPQSAPISVTHTLTRDGIVNDFTVSGTGTGNAAPVRATASDTNPGDPTFIGGPFGDVANFTTANLILTQAQAQAAANNALAISLSSAQQVNITCAPNPLFAVDDVVTVTRARLGLNQTPVVLDTITHVISPQQTMTLTGRVVG